MDLEQLRRETLPDHNAVEQSVPLMDEELDADIYVSYLLKLHGMIAAWEESGRAECSVHGSNRCWLARRRGAAFDARPDVVRRRCLRRTRGLPCQR